MVNLFQRKYLEKEMARERKDWYLRFSRPEELKSYLKQENLMDKDDKSSLYTFEFVSY